MKIIRNKTTFQVIYQFKNNENIELTENHLVTKNFRALDVNSNTHEIIEKVKGVEQWMIPAMGYDTDWFIYNQEIYDNNYEQQLEREIEKKCDDIFDIRLQKTYADVEVVFPDGVGTIQLRNDFDRQNLSDIALGALAIATLQNPNKYMTYRDAENVTHTLRAGEMIEIALTVLEIKQTVVSKSWEKKDAVRGLTTLEDVRKYNIHEDWPEE